MSDADLMLLNVENMLILDTQFSIARLTREYPHWFNDPEPGVYTLSSLDPVIKKDVVYYHGSINQDEPVIFDHTPTIDDITIYKKGLFHEDGLVVLSPAVIQNAKRLLRNESFVSKAAFTVIEYIIRDAINNSIAYGDTVHREMCFPFEYKHYLTQEGQDAYAEGQFENMCEGLLIQAVSFVSERPWSIYFTRPSGSDLIIERLIDYRIYDWTKRFSKDIDE